VVPAFFSDSQPPQKRALLAECGLGTSLARARKARDIKTTGPLSGVGAPVCRSGLDFWVARHLVHAELWASPDVADGSGAIDPLGLDLDADFEHLVQVTGGPNRWIETRLRDRAGPASRPAPLGGRGRAGGRQFNVV
jgi:hypothetical protein